MEGPLCEAAKRDRPRGHDVAGQDFEYVLSNAKCRNSICERNTIGCVGGFEDT